MQHQDSAPALLVPGNLIALLTSLILPVFRCRSWPVDFVDRSCTRPLDLDKRSAKSIVHLETWEAVAWTSNAEYGSWYRTSHHRIRTGIDAVRNNQTSSHERPHWLRY